MALDRITIPRVWRSQWRTLILVGVSGLAAFLFTETALRSSAVNLLEQGGVRRAADLIGLIWCIPLGLFLKAAYTKFNVRYSVDARAIEMRQGRLSLRQSITRIRFEDIRSIEASQTVVEQMLSIGSVTIGTAASAGLEVGFFGIGNPREVQQVIQQERDRRERA